MFSAIPRSLLRFACRFFPQERGKFRILNEIYLRRLAPKSGTWVLVKLRGGIRMKLDIAEFLQSHLYLFGSYELPTVRFIERYLKPNDVAMDVGAQIGYLTLVMATSANGMSRIISFEPEEVNIQRFTENMSLNKVENVQLITSAVSKEVGTLRLYLSVDHNSGTHSTIATDPNVGNQYEEVPATTVDAVVAQLKLERLDLMKIDVEGAEIEVVLGALATLESLKPVLIIEMSEEMQKSRGSSTPEFKRMMSGYGYMAFSIQDNGLLDTTELESVHAMDNLVFVHADRQPELLERLSKHRA